EHRKSDGTARRARERHLHSVGRPQGERALDERHARPEIGLTYDLNAVHFYGAGRDAVLAIRGAVRDAKDERRAHGSRYAERIAVRVRRAGRADVLLGPEEGLAGRALREAGPRRQRKRETGGEG